MFVVEILYLIWNSSLMIKRKQLLIVRKMAGIISLMQLHKNHLEQNHMLTISTGAGVPVRPPSK